MAVHQKTMVGGVVQEDTPGKTVTMTQGKVAAPQPAPGAPPAQPAPTVAPAQPAPTAAPAQPGGKPPTIKIQPAVNAARGEYVDNALAQAEQTGSMVNPQGVAKGILGAVSELDTSVQSDPAQYDAWIDRLGRTFRFQTQGSQEARDLQNTLEFLKKAKARAEAFQAIANMEVPTDLQNMPPEQMGAAATSLQNFLSQVQSSQPEALTDPNHPLYGKVQAAQGELAKIPSITQRGEMENLYGQLQSMAQGEGLEDSAAQQQLAQGFEQAQAQVQGQAAGPMGIQSARASRLAAIQQSALTAQQAQTSRMVQAQEQQWALQMASQLGQDLEQELAQADFSDAQVRQRTAELYSGYANAMSDISADMRSAELVAEARRKAAEDASKDAWMRTIIGGAFTLGGTALGTMAGGPVGGAVGGTAGGMAGNFVAGKL